MKIRDVRRERFSMMQWNEKHGVGTSVTVVRDSGDVVKGETRSAAFLTEGEKGYAVIFITGISGYYLLNRVKAVV